MLELVTRDGIISVIPGKTGLVDKVALGCCSIGVANEIVSCDSEGMRVVEVNISGIAEEMGVVETADVTSLSGWVVNGAVISDRLVESSRAEVIAELPMLAPVTSDGIISVTPGEPVSVGMAERGCSPMWVTEETVECCSERIGDVEATRSGPVVETVVVRTPEVSSLSA